MLPDAMIVVQLRDPIERAVSNWRFSSDHGVERRSLVEALEDELAGRLLESPSGLSVSPFAYASRGRYTDYLVPWLEAFPDRVRVLLLEDSLQGPHEVRRLLRELGLDDTIDAGLWARRENASRGPGLALPDRLRSALLAYYEESAARLSQLLARELPWPTTTETGADA